MKKIFLGVSGASGSLYALKLIDILSDMDDVELHLSVTPDGLTNINLETGNDYKSVKELAKGNTVIHDYKNFAAGPSSGSFKVDHYIIAPASMGCVGRIAGGISSNLIERCADVAMKERRDLIILFREAPLNNIHLENLLKLSQSGAVIFPAAPAFYHQPENIDELINFVIGKIFDIIGINHELFNRWNG